MARVLHYRRSLDAILTNEFQVDKLPHLEFAVRVKDEPSDPEETKDFPGFNEGNSGKPGSTILATGPTCSSSNNKENEYLSRKKRKAKKRDYCYFKRKRRFNKSVRQRQGASENVKHAEKQRKHFTEIRENSYQKSESTATIRTRRQSGRHSGIADPASSTRESQSDTQAKTEKPCVPPLMKCSVCRLKFSRSSDLKFHHNLYDVRQPAKCPKCKVFYFTPYTTFVRHSRYCSGRRSVNARYDCHFCGSSMFRKAQVQAHIFHSHYDMVYEKSSKNSAHPVKRKSSSNTNLTPETVRTVMADQSESPQATPNNHQVTNYSTSEALNLDNRVLPTPKKMRQTTLVEFLKPDKNQHSSPSPSTVRKQNRAHTITEQSRNGDKRTEISSGSTANSKTGLSPSRTLNDTSPSSSKRKKPFVQIHADPNLMMELLSNSAVIKSEPPDDSFSETHSVHHSSPYSLRTKGTDQQAVKQTRTLRKRKHSQSDSIDGSDSKKTKKSLNPQEGKLEVLKLKFKIKECSVRLVPCQLFPQKDSTVNFDSTPIKSVRTPVSSPSKNTDVPLTPRCNTQSSVTEAHHTPSVENDINVHEKRHPCNICKKKFRSKANLREHLDLCHVVYISSICNARYTSKRKLLHHYLRHTTFRKNNCCVCGKSFNNRSLLQRHLLVHCKRVLNSASDIFPMDTDVKCNALRKKYKCKLCVKQFWLDSCLKQHEVVYHARGQLKESLTSGVIESAATNTENVSDKVELTNNVEPQAANNEQLVANDESSPPEADTQATKLTEKKYECKVCHRSYESIQKLVRHELRYAGSALHRCSICGTAFTSKRLLRRHIKTTHTPESVQKYKLRCRYCNQGFLKMNNHNTHERHFHASQIAATPLQTWLNQEQVWNINTVCSTCNLVFESFEMFIEHNMYYYKGHVFMCTFCDQTFHGMYTLHRHSKLKHYPEAARKSYLYSCDTCNEGFNLETHVHAHKLHVHSNDDKPQNVSTETTRSPHSPVETNSGSALGVKQFVLGIYTCSVCHMIFTNETDLGSHDLEYATDGDYQCSKCNKLFRSLDVLNQHYSVNHTGGDLSDAYKCRTCGEVLTTAVAMKCHERHVHSNEIIQSATRDHSYHCSKVPVKSKRTSNPTSVIKVTEGNTEQGNLKCFTCGTTFKEFIELKNHLLEYSNIGEHVCAVCHRKFAEFERLQVHKQKHSRLNTILSEHHCPICQEGFDNAATVSTHVSHLHGYESFQNVFNKHGCFKIAVPSLNAKTVAASKSKDSSKSRLSEKTISSTNPLTEKNQSNSMNLSDVISSMTESPTVLNGSNNTSTGKRASFTCPMCGLQYNSRKNLGKHLARYVNSGKYECGICHQKFPWQTVFMEHSRKHINADRNDHMFRYACNYCDQKFRTLRSAKCHVGHIHGKSLTEDLSDSSNTGIAYNNSSVTLTQGVFLDNEAISNDVTLVEQRNNQTPLQPSSSTDILQKDPLAITSTDKESVLESTNLSRGHLNEGIVWIKAVAPTASQARGTIEGARLEQISASVDESNALKIVWDKKTDDQGSKLVISSPRHPSEDKFITTGIAINIVNPIQLTNINSVRKTPSPTHNGDKRTTARLKVKPFAKILESLSLSNSSKSTDIVTQTPGEAATYLADVSTNPLTQKTFS